MSRQKVDNDMITGLTSSKLTGAMPAIDASALTGVGDGITKNASDPATDTNPSDGVGALWLNTTDSNLFACTDATTDANVWYNVGGGDGDVVPYKFQGTSYGYAVGDQNSPSNVIDKYSYTSQANATDVGDLTSARGRTGGHKSQTHGWASGGGGGSTIIEKWAFASDGNSVDSNKDLSTATRFGAGASSGTHGFSGGGSGPSALHNVIGKFSFSDGSNATDIGDLTVQRERASGHSSSTDGYMAGGSNFEQAGGITNVIDKYSFSSNGNATDVGDLTTNRAPDGGGTSSETHGFTNGGHSGVGNDVTIDKYSFASNNNATDVGDMAVSCRHPVSTSATAHGYFAGGFDVASPVNNIQRYAYASTANATDWADLTVARLQGCSSQV